MSVKLVQEAENEICLETKKRRLEAVKALIFERQELDAEIEELYAEIESIEDKLADVEKGDYTYIDNYIKQK